MNVNIRNELNFSEDHEGINRSGLLAKFRGSFTLHATHCGSYLHEPQKKKKIKQPLTEHNFLLLTRIHITNVLTTNVLNANKGCLKIKPEN